MVKGICQWILYKRLGYKKIITPVSYTHLKNLREICALVIVETEVEFYIRIAICSSPNETNLKFSTLALEAL